MSAEHSWAVIKRKIVRDAKPGSVGYSIVINDAAALFVVLAPFLKDYETAKAAFNVDEDVMKALLQRPMIDEMKKAGII